MSGNITLAAVDLDGTLLGPDLTISPENMRAVEDLQRSGAEVVVASGRHYDSIRPFAERIPGVEWIVSVQGAEVSDAGRTSILRRVFFEESDARQAIGLGHRLGFSAMVYTADGILTESVDRDDLAFYTGLTGRVPVNATRADILEEEIQKIVWVGEPVRISELRTIDDLDRLAVQKIHTHARLYEFMPHSADKGSALGVLAEHLNISPQNVAVFGDGENDIPMFRWAGQSVAMAHGWPRAKASAGKVTPDGPPETAFARAVEMVLKT